MQQKETELIELILGLTSQDNKQSTAQLALKNARNMRNSNPFLSLLLYLISMEQFGDLFCIKRNDSFDSNKIVLVLQEYSLIEFNERQLNAIKHLRHSLCHHSLGLVCNNKKEKSEKRDKNYKFILSFSENPEIVICPATKWDGCYDNIDYVERSKFDLQTSFQISIPSLIDVFERTVESIKQKYITHQLSFVLPYSQQSLESRLKEIEHKYFIYTHQS